MKITTQVGKVEMMIICNLWANFVILNLMEFPVLLIYLARNLILEEHLHLEWLRRSKDDDDVEGDLGEGDDGDEDDSEGSEDDSVGNDGGHGKEDDHNYGHHVPGNGGGDDSDSDGEDDDDDDDGDQDEDEDEDEEDEGEDEGEVENDAAGNDGVSEGQGENEPQVIEHHNEAPSDVFDPFTSPWFEHYFRTGRPRLYFVPASEVDEEDLIYRRQPIADQWEVDLGRMIPVYVIPTGLAPGATEGMTLICHVRDEWCYDQQGQNDRATVFEVMPVFEQDLRNHLQRQPGVPTTFNMEFQTRLYEEEELDIPTEFHNLVGFLTRGRIALLDTTNQH